MRRPLRTLAYLVFIAAMAVDLAATTARRLSNEEMADTADIIVIGRVVDVRSVWENPRTLVTVATVSVSERLKGEVGDTIAVALPGGADANRKFPIAVTYAGAPRMNGGEDVFLFLSQDSDISSGLTVVGFSQGKFSIVGDGKGGKNFNEERWNRRFEDDLERRPGDDSFVPVLVGRTTDGINITTNRTINIDNFGAQDFIGFTLAPPGRYYAVRVLADQIPDTDFIVHSVSFSTGVADASVAPVFSEALLTSGTINPDGTAAVDLLNPLVRKTSFVGQDNDFAPLLIRRPRELGQRIRDGIADGSITNLFLVLRVPPTTPFPGISNIPPLIGLDGGVAMNDVPIQGRSFISDDGGTTFTPNATFNFRFSLVLSEKP